MISFPKREGRGGRRQRLAFVRSVGSARGVSFIPLPTLSGNPPSDAEHRDASSSPNHPSSLPEPPLHVSLCSCQLVKLPPPPSPTVCLAASNTNPSANRIELPPRSLLSTPMSSSFSFGSTFQGWSLSLLPFHPTLFFFFFLLYVLDGLDSF